MEIDDIKKLIDLVDKSDLQELVVEEGGKKISLRKGGAAGHSVGPVPGIVPSEPAVEKPSLQPVSPGKNPAIPEGDRYYKVESPMVGTFYRAAAEGSAPYVTEGDNVKKGQVLCIVEAMKLMNEIESEVSGKVISILGENAKPVEFGEPLFVIEKDT